jgi:hypothetical protein
MIRLWRPVGALLQKSSLHGFFTVFLGRERRFFCAFYTQYICTAQAVAGALIFAAPL